jgi:voltage-gated potassium channel
MNGILGAAGDWGKAGVGTSAVDNVCRRVENQAAKLPFAATSTNLLPLHVVKPSVSKSAGHVAEGDIPLHANLTLAETLRPFGPRFAGAAVYFVVVFAIASVGYHGIEGWTWFESFYMAVTTVTSVGFMEVHELSTAGRGFTTFVILLGVTGLGIWWALITALIVELDLGGALRRRRKMKSIESLKDHYIICGAGRVGRIDRELVVIERDVARAQRLEDDFPDVLVLCADATKERILTEARVQVASGLAACLADDADNLLVCLTVRDLSQDVSIVARAYDEESMAKLRRAGADHVISPTITGGIRIASSFLRPKVLSFMDSAVVGPDMDLRLEEAEIPPDSPLVGLSLREVAIPQHTGLVVIAIQGEKQVYNPGPETVLGAGDVMIVLGHPDQLHRLNEYLRGAG